MAASFLLHGAIMKTNLSPMLVEGQGEDPRASPFMAGANVGEVPGFIEAVEMHQAMNPYLSFAPNTAAEGGRGLEMQHFQSPLDPTVYLRPSYPPQQTMLFPPRLDASMFPSTAQAPGTQIGMGRLRASMMVRKMPSEGPLASGTPKQQEGNNAMVRNPTTCIFSAVAAEAKSPRELPPTK